MQGHAPSIVPFAPHHGRAVVDLIGSVFDEYGMTFEPGGFDADLQDIDRHYTARGGWFYVLVEEGRVAGTVAAVPKDAATVEMKRLYLSPGQRGRGQGRALIEHILDRIRGAGYAEAIAWSDVRLETAHKVYERLGFEPIGERSIDDIDQSREYGFRKRLTAG